MKKFFNDNMVYFVLLAMAVAGVALFFALKNRKKLDLLPEDDTLWAKTLATLKETDAQGNTVVVDTTTNSDEIAAA